MVMVDTRESVSVRRGILQMKDGRSVDGWMEMDGARAERASV